MTSALRSASLRRRLVRHAWVKSRYLAGQLSSLLRERMRPPDERVALESLQRRLEIVLAATYGRAIPVAAVPDDRPPRGIKRAIATLRTLGHVQSATTDGASVMLPSHMPHGVSPDAALTRYRLMAIEQAERLVRGTTEHLPATDSLARDLYLLREAQAVDRAIARANAGLAHAIGAARQEALLARPASDRLSRIEQAVETLTREALARDVVADAHASATTGDDSPELSAAWALATADEMRALPGVYRGIAPVPLWGSHRAHALTKATVPDDAPPTDTQSASGTNAVAMPIGNSAANDRPADDAANIGVASVTDDDSPELDADLSPVTSSHDPTGGHDVYVQDAGDPDDDAALLPGIPYPEWDATTGRYLPNGATVRIGEAAEGDESWAATTLAGRASLMRRVQQQFERLRARRVRLTAQRRGDDIDLAACVRAIVDRRAGLSPDERHYTDTRPARRGLAITLLVDVSGSTDAQVTHALQIIDIEKIALLLATTAFDALGDAYNVLTFTGRGAADVRVCTVKSFEERSGLTVRRRIAALRPEGGTRLGAAVRHAVSLLQRQPAGHRLLLILSDGRPNDVGYMDEYAVEDSRQAILEARASGVFPFCLTVDRDGADYLPHVFGSTGHVIIRNPEQLPSALLRAVRQLLRFA